MNWLFQKAAILLGNGYPADLGEVVLTTNRFSGAA
jgi:hypothetical protein